MNIDSRFPSINALSVELSSYGKHEETDESDENGCPIVLKKKSFPASLKKIFLGLIPGNDVCPDCEVRGSIHESLHQFKYGLPLKEKRCLQWAK